MLFIKLFIVHVYLCFPDINECNSTTGGHKCAHICVNTLGSYACACRSGHKLDKYGLACKQGKPTTTTITPVSVLIVAYTRSLSQLLLILNAFFFLLSSSNGLANQPTIRAAMGLDNLGNCHRSCYFGDSHFSGGSNVSGYFYA